MMNAALIAMYARRPTRAAGDAALATPPLQPSVSDWVSIGRGAGEGLRSVAVVATVATVAMSVATIAHVAKHWGDR